MLLLNLVPVASHTKKQELMLIGLYSAQAAYFASYLANNVAACFGFSWWMVTILSVDAPWEVK